MIDTYYINLLERDHHHQKKSCSCFTVIMSRNGEVDEENYLRGEEGEASTSPTPRTKPKRDLCLVFCRCFSVLVALAAILCIFVNVLSAIRSFKNGRDIFDGIFRCYAIAIGVLIVVTETEWQLFFKFARVLEYWPGRGMLQIFVAVMTRAFPDYTGKNRNLVLVQDISSYLLLACGVIYLILGVLCCGFLKRARQRSHQSKIITRAQAAKDLEEVERRREELETALVANA